MFLTKQLSMVALAAMFACANAQTTNAQLPRLQVVGNEIHDECGSKVILRGVSTEYLNIAAGSSGGVSGLIERIVNTEDDASSSPGWYTRIIRFPVNPSNWNSDRTEYLNDHIIPAVNKATELGLYVIIDWHYVDDVDNGNNASLTADFWEETAPIFKDYKNVWYELYNEPKMGLAWSSLKNHFQSWYDIVRKHAPENIVLIGSETWSQNPQHGCDDPVIGTNIAYVAHMYANHFPWLNNTVISATQCVPVVMTEWGFRDALNWDPQGGDEEDIATFGQPMMDMMDQHGIHWTAWCASEDFEPAMFYPGWELRVGPGEMGGFVKDALYDRRNADQPCIDTDGPFTLTTRVNGAGTITRNPDKTEYEGGETVTITATPSPDAQFWGWDGTTGASDQLTIEIEMTGNRSVSANFIIPHLLPGKVEAEDYHSMDGIQTEDCEDEGLGLNVGWTAPDDWMVYMINVASFDHYDFLFRTAANGDGDSEFEVLIDDVKVGIQPQTLVVGKNGPMRIY